MKSQLINYLKQLRLGGLLGALDIRLNEAKANSLTHEEFLELIIQDEITIRDDRAVQRRIEAAKFRDQKRLEDFDFHFNRSINKNQIMEFATCEFIRKSKDIFFLGPPGVGKSHLAQGLGYQAAKSGFAVIYRSIFDATSDLMQAETFNEKNKMLNRYLKPDLLIIDDMGLKKLPKTAGEHLFEIIMRRYELRSTIMTSNRPIEEWGNLLGDVPTATAILDRFLSRAEIIQIKGASYRLKDIKDKSCKNKN